VLSHLPFHLLTLPPLVGGHARKIAVDLEERRRQLVVDPGSVVERVEQQIPVCAVAGNRDSLAHARQCLIQFSRRRLEIGALDENVRSQGGAVRRGTGDGERSVDRVARAAVILPAELLEPADAEPRFCLVVDATRSLSERKDPLIDRPCLVPPLHDSETVGRP
jgi:hypothetical protein